MKEKNKLENLKRFKNWLDGNVSFILVIIIIIAITSGISYIVLHALYDNVFVYPENEYEQLEDEFYNIISTDNKIDFAKLSDKSVEYEEIDNISNSSKKHTISLTKKLEETWGREIKVSVEFSESINIEKMIFKRDRNQLFNLIAFVCLCVVVSLLIFYVTAAFVAYIIIVPIEKKLQKKIDTFSNYNKIESY